MGGTGRGCNEQPPSAMTPTGRARLQTVSDEHGSSSFRWPGLDPNPKPVAGGDMGENGLRSLIWLGTALTVLGSTTPRTAHARTSSCSGAVFGSMELDPSVSPSIGDRSVENRTGIDVGETTARLARTAATADPSKVSGTPGTGARSRSHVPRLSRHGGGQRARRWTGG